MANTRKLVTASNRQRAVKKTIASARKGSARAQSAHARAKKSGLAPKIDRRFELGTAPKESSARSMSGFFRTKARRVRAASKKAK